MPDPSLPPDTLQSSLSFSVAGAFWLQLREIMVIVLSTIITFIAIDGAGLHPVVASVCVGLAGSSLPAFGAINRTTLHACIYTGSFAGMCSGSMITGLHEVVNIGMATGVVALLFRDRFVGIGGKMGTMAFAGNVLWLWSDALRFGGLVGANLVVPAIAGVACGAFATFELVQRSEVLKKRIVAASATVTLGFCLLWILLASLWEGWPQFLDFEQSVAWVFCGTFMGMSVHRSIDRATISIAVLLLGAVFPFVFSMVGLYGGALGFLAFVSLLMALALKKIFVRCVSGLR